MKAELEFKEEESQKIKKTIKFTRIQEMETEKKALQDETIRLKHMLEQALKQNYAVKMYGSPYILTCKRYLTPLIGRSSSFRR